MANRHRHIVHGPTAITHRPYSLLFLIALLTICPFMLPWPATSTRLYAADCATNLRDLSSALNHYNLITLNDLSTTSDVEGRTFVGGDLVSTNSATFASALKRTLTTESTLDIVGDLAPGNPLNLEAGSVHLGGEQNGRIINLNGGGSLVYDPSLADIDMIAILENGSLDLANLTTNNIATIPTGQPAPLRFIVDDVQSTAPAIFAIDAADIFENQYVQQIELLPHRAETIVINVSGTTVDWNFGNMIGNFVNKNWRGNLIWNFYEATTINLNGHNFMGALLAPLADVTTSGNIDGSVAVRSLTTTAEVHQPEYVGQIAGTCPTVTPTPAITPTHTPTITPTATHTPVPMADLTISKYSNPNPVIAGKLLTYTIVVTNHGPGDAENVTVIDQLPPDVSFRSASAECTHQSGRVTCVLGALPIGWIAFLTVEVDVEATSTVSN